MAESNIITMRHEKDGPMLRFYADRKLRARGYGSRGGYMDTTPVDPVAEQKRTKAVRLVGAIIKHCGEDGMTPSSPTTTLGDWRD